MPSFALADGYTIFGSDTEPTRQIRQVNAGITKLFPRLAPFVTALDKLSAGAQLRANMIEWYQRGAFNPHVTMTAEEAANGASFTVDDTSGLVVGTTLHDPRSGEQIKVLSIQSATAFTAGTRGNFGGGTPLILPVGQELLILQAAIAEGAVAVDPIGIKAQKDFNYGQQFELAWSLTDKMRQIAHYGTSDPFTDAEMTIMEEYRKRTNRTFLFGHRSVQAAGASGGGSHGSWSAGGMIDFIDAYAENKIDANGALTYDELLDAIIPANIFHQSSPARYLGLLGPKVKRIIDGWNLSRYERSSDYSETFGFEVSKLVGGGLEVMLMEDANFQFDSYYDKCLMLINLDEVQHLIGHGMSDTVNREITGPKKDGSHTIKNQITGVHTLVVDRPATHFLIHNITS